MESLGHAALTEALKLLWYLSNYGEWNDFSASTRTDVVEHSLEALSKASNGGEAEVLAAFDAVRTSFANHPFQAKVAEFLNGLEPIFLRRVPVDTAMTLVK